MKQGIRVHAFLIKIVAFASLACYAVAFSGFISSTPLKLLLSILGGVSLPLFALLIDEAYRKTNHLNRLMLRALLIALLAAFPYRYAYASTQNLGHVQSFFSAALTSFCCIGALVLYDRMKTRNQRAFCVVFLCALSILIGMELGPYALMCTFLIHIFRDRKFIQTAYYITSFAVVFAGVNLFFWLGTQYEAFSSSDELIRNIGIVGAILALPLIKKYDGTKGPSNRCIRFFSYTGYVIILSVLVAVKLLLHRA